MSRYSIIFILILCVFSNITIADSATNDNIEFSHRHGFYTQPFTLKINTDIPGALLYYTLNGSDPLTSNSQMISASPLNINIDPGIIADRDLAPGFIVRVCALVDEKIVGTSISQTYVFTNNIVSHSRDNILPGPEWLALGSKQRISYGLDPEIYDNPKYSDQILDAFLSIPTISLVTDLGNLFDPDSGIYVNARFHGKEWERKASLELLDPDGSEGFQINCGVRIRGGWSRHSENPKHAFRIIFRNEYGESKLKYPLFGVEGVDEFKKIDLRTSQNYSWSYYGDYRNTFVREVFSRVLNTQRDMNQPYSRSRYYHLFLNGTYWGLYQTQERTEASYAASYFGGRAEDYDVIKVNIGDNFDAYNIEATDGTLGKWMKLWDAGQQGFADNELYLKVQGLNLNGSLNPNYEKLLDVDNLIDYMIITFFVGDFDGPVSRFLNDARPNNFYAVYNRVNPDGIKFFRHDGEHSLFDVSWGLDRTGPYTAGQNSIESNPHWFHQKLSENSLYRLKFADRVYKHFFNSGALSIQNNIKRISDRKSEIETAIIAESARWGDSDETLNFPLTKDDWENEINSIINNYLPTRQNIVLNQLKNKGLYFETATPKFNVHGGIVEKNFEVEISSPAGSIYYTIDGTDPFVSMGSLDGSFSKQVVEPSTSKKIMVPVSTISDDWYSKLNFNDDSWFDVNGTSGGIGYDNKGIYTQYISFNTKNYMHESATNPNTSCFIRIPFPLDEANLELIKSLNLDLLYDDGFVAYINGVKILQVNAPDIQEYNSTSLTFLDSQGYERFSLNEYITYLQPGENLLAFHR